MNRSILFCLAVLLLAPSLSLAGDPVEKVLKIHVPQSMEVRLETPVAGRPERCTIETDGQVVPLFKKVGHETLSQYQYLTTRAPRSGECPDRANVFVDYSKFH